MSTGGTPARQTPSAILHAHGDSHDLAVLLEPALRHACNERLGPVQWFHSTWQRGGAATGFAPWKLGDGTTTEVLVKLPVGPTEHRWTCALGAFPREDWVSDWALGLPTPRVLASGVELGGADLAWLVVERLDGPSLAKDLGEQGVEDLLRAAADFQAAAMRIEPLRDRPRSPDWEKTIAYSRELVRNGSIPDGQHWNEALKKVQRHLDHLRHRWESRPINAWCHGDLHHGNALRRRLPDGSTVRRGCVLVDLAMVHPGHWIEDALYLERQYWGHEPMLGGVKPISMLAALRRARSQPADDNYNELAMTRRVLAAACAPALMEREGNLKYLAAALGIIGKYLPQVVH